MKTLLLVVGGLWLYSVLANDQNGGTGNGGGPTASAPTTSALTQLLSTLTHGNGGGPSGVPDNSAVLSPGATLSPILTNNPAWNPYILPFHNVS